MIPRCRRWPSGGVRDDDEHRRPGAVVPRRATPGPSRPRSHQPQRRPTWERRTTAEPLATGTPPVVIVPLPHRTTPATDGPVAPPPQPPRHPTARGAPSSSFPDCSGKLLTSSHESEVGGGVDGYCCSCFGEREETRKRTRRKRDRVYDSAAVSPFHHGET